MTNMSYRTLSPAQARGLMLALLPVVVVIVALYAAARQADSVLVRDWLDNTHWTLAYGTAAVLGWLAVRWSDEASRPARRWFAYGLTAGIVGQVVWDIQFALNVLSFPAPSDFIFVLTGPCFIRALLLSVRQHSPRALGWPLFLDSATLAIATLAFVMVLFLPTHSNAFSPSFLFTALVPSTLLSGTCFSLIIWPTLRLQPRQGWLVMFTGTALNGYLWLQWIYLAQSDRVDTNPWLFLAFSLVTVLMGIGAVVWRMEVSHNPLWARRSDNLLRMMPLLVLVVTAMSVALVWSIPTLPMSVTNTIYLSGAVVLVLATLRQSLMLADRDRMLASEQRAGELERTFEALFRVPYGGVALLDADGRFLRVSPGCSEMLGRSAEVLSTLRAQQVCLTPDEEKLHGPLGLVDCSGTGTLEVMCHRGDGTPVHLEVTSALIPDSGGQVFVVLRDITDRIRDNEARLRLEAQLQQSQKLEAIGTFASGIAHDFNNILSAILGNVELAVQDIDRQHPSQANLQEIRKSSQRARELVRRIVAFGKPQPLQTRLQPLKPVIEDSLTLVRAALPATVQIDSQLDSNVPPVNIDSAQIDQVLLNLCTNAWHAMPHQKGRIEIRLSTSEISTATVASAGELQPGRYARLSVCDNGTGIDPLILPRIFEPFFTTKPAGEGTGLGLSIVYNIVRGHAGAIIVSSPPGHGTCFDIYLPLNGAGAPEMQTAPALTPINTQGSGQHIVYIDDEEALVILTVKMLQRLGYQVTGFTDAEAALQSLQTGAVHPDVVITDQSMPGMTGSELARVLLRQYPGMLMILVSGYLPAEEIELARQQGFRAVILKPDTVDQMARTIHDVLSEQQAAVMMPQ